MRNNKSQSQYSFIKQEERKMNIAIYIRYAEGCPGVDIEGQRTACHKYAAAHGHNIFGEYIDCSTDGADGGRSAFAKMIRDSRKRRFEGILIYSADRFSRDVYELVTYKLRLEKMGIALISATESCLVAPSVLLIERLLQAYAEYLHDEHSEKVKRGLRLAKERKAALAAAEKQADT